MGQGANQLHKKLLSKSSGLPTKVPKRRPGEPLFHLGAVSAFQAVNLEFLAAT